MLCTCPLKVWNVMSVGVIEYLVCFVWNYVIIYLFYKEWICFRSFVRNGKFSYSPKNNSHIRWKANRFHRVDIWWLSFKWNGKSIYDKLILPNWFHNVPIIYFYSWGSMFVRRHAFPALFGRNFVSTCSVLGIILMNI